MHRGFGLTPIQNNRYAPSNSASDWWYSYNNQCSVYNTDATQTQKGAGAGGSDVFAILYGYQDSMNQSYMKCPELSFVEPVTLKSLEYCNSSYVYGVLENGNQFGDSIIVIAQRSKYLADYQDSHSEVVPVHTWTMWNFAEDGGVIGGVKTIKFNFDGSDKSAWGLNTPAYICLDNINVSF